MPDHSTRYSPPIPDDDIKSCKMLRRLCRFWALDGCWTREETGQKLGLAEKTLSKYTRIIRGVLGEYLNRGHGDSWRVNFTMFDEGQNPLLRVFCRRCFGRAGVGIALRFLAEAEQAQEPVSVNDLMRKADDMPIDERTARGCLKTLVDDGYLVKKSRGKYELAPDVFRALNADALERLLDAVDFMMNTTPPAACGYFLYKTLELYIEAKGCSALSSRVAPFTFLHSHIVLALDDDIVWTLLTAMSEGRTVSFGYLDANKQEETISAVPIKIVTDRAHGRRYLLAIRDGDEKVISPFRLDRISDAKALEPHGTPHEGIESLCAAHLTHSLFGTQTKHRGEREYKLVKLRVAADRGALAAAIRRLLPDHEAMVQEDGTTLISARVNDTLELKPWLRRHLGAVTVEPGSDAVFYEEWTRELADWRAKYEIEARSHGTF